MMGQFINLIDNCLTNNVTEATIKIGRYEKKSLKCLGEHWNMYRVLLLQISIHSKVNYNS